MPHKLLVWISNTILFTISLPHSQLDKVSVILMLYLLLNSHTSANRWRRLLGALHSLMTKIPGKVGIFANYSTPSGHTQLTTIVNEKNSILVPP